MGLDPTPGRRPQRVYGDALHPQTAPSNLADILERVLDKGIVIAGDIQLNLLDIELITLKIRLLIASVDRAREMGINWWESDPTLTVPREEKVEFRAEFERDGDREELEARIERLERLLESGKGDSAADETKKGETGRRQATTRQTGGACTGSGVAAPARGSLVRAPGSGSSSCRRSSIAWASASVSEARMRARASIRASASRSAASAAASSSMASRNRSKGSSLRGIPAS